MSSSDSIDLDEIYTFTKDLAGAAAQKLLDSLDERRQGSSQNGGSAPSVQEKDNAVDIVTKTDQDVETFIHSAIQKRYPSHTFIGEETYAARAGSQRAYIVPSSGPSWCVDPLDGTVNYVHGFGMFCVSIAFLLDGVPVIGVIAAPLLNQTFHACRGRGAWLSTVRYAGISGASSPSMQHLRLPLFGTPSAPPLPPQAPKGCVFAFEWGKDRRDVAGGNLARKVDSVVTMATEPAGRKGSGGMVHGVRSLGSAALDLAYTAMGSFDVWWEGGCWEWDVAAGIAILNEAGGLITTANPPGEGEGVDDAPVSEARLGGRLYLAVRPVGANELGESGRTQQERLVREVWRRVKQLDYSRPGA